MIYVYFGFQTLFCTSPQKIQIAQIVRGGDAEEDKKILGMAR
jgi:hypothetical protein